jgi:hypothetical protein
MWAAGGRPPSLLETLNARYEVVGLRMVRPSFWAEGNRALVCDLRGSSGLGAGD